MKGLPTEAEARQLATRVLAAVRRIKTADGNVRLSATRAGNTRFAVNEITSSADVDRVELSVTVQLGKRAATATTNQLDDRSVADVVDRAHRMAKLAPENPEAMPALGAQIYKRAKAAADPATVKLTPDARAKAAGAAIASGDGAKVAIAGFYEHAQRALALASTAGLWAYHAWTTAGMTATARTPDGTGSGWAGASSNRGADVDAGALAKLAVDKAVRSQKPTRLDPGRYTVILEPAATAAMLSFLVGALSARRADEGRSYFAKPGGTRVGDKLFPDAITLRSDPTDAQLAATPFDREGVPIAPATWIDKGTLKGLAYDRYWAKKQGKPPTGRPDGWILDGGKATTEQLLAGVKRGVLVTRMWYLRSLDPQTLLVTGLTRDGTFLVEDGKITRPVMNFRFNESPVQMLGKCDALGVPVLVSGMRVPALRTHEFNLASISEAV
ncbi:MAG TPA: TldD/PmbA family protein [Kofleriaceae bacterium]|nr:TldD/PmbA family protein [Kofleriaceae bacterium]